MSDVKKILVGEDSSVIINLTKSILSFEKYHIDSAKNGKKVLEHLNKGDYDLILMDLNMPVMDGIECTRQIRELEDHKKANTPIIAISGNSKNFTHDEFRQMGFNYFIQKPLDYDAVLATVKKLLK